MISKKTKQWLDNTLERDQFLIDKRNDIIFYIIQAFFDWYDKAMTPDYEKIENFVWERKEEINNILTEHEQNERGEQ